MDRGHALDGAPGARGSPELPTLIIRYRDGRRSGKHLPARDKAGRAAVAPSPPKVKTTYVMASGAPDAIAATHVLSFTYRYTGRERGDLLLQLVHGDLVYFAIELALADLLPTDAPVVLGHRRAGLGGHLRT
jgi:hypothetical protein